MHTRTVRVVFLLTLSGLALRLSSQQPSQQPATPSVDYRRDIQPILTTNCAKCHAGNAAPAEFKLDTPEGLMHGGTSGAAVIAGRCGAQPTRGADGGFQREQSHASVANAAVSARDIALIKEWIKSGAKVGGTTVDFAKDMQPILQAACYSCHSGTDVKGGLHLDVKAEALKGGALGHDIVPGQSNDSLLLHRVIGDNGMARMPMGGTPLAPPQVAMLKTWIEQGANWPDSAGAPKHWAYVKPVRPRCFPL